MSESEFTEFENEQNFDGRILKIVLAFVGCCYLQTVGLYTPNKLYIVRW